MGVTCLEELPNCLKMKRKKVKSMMFDLKFRLNIDMKH